MKKIVSENSSSLSNLGITVDSDGKLSENATTLNTASQNGDLSKFIGDNENKSGFFYKIKSISAKLNEDNTYYLSDISKQVIKKASISTNIGSNGSESSTFDVYV